MGRDTVTTCQMFQFEVVNVSDVLSSVILCGVSPGWTVIVTVSVAAGRLGSLTAMVVVSPSMMSLLPSGKTLN